MTSNRYRLCCATIPSAVFSLSLCLSAERDQTIKNILIFNSDYYTGTNLEEYELVMESLAQGIGEVDKIAFINGLRNEMRYSGRRRGRGGTWCGLYDSFMDARLVDEKSGVLIGRDRSVADAGVCGQNQKIAEIWADITNSIPRILFAKYSEARKVLYPHAPSIHWGTNPSEFTVISGNEETGKAGSLKKRLRDTIVRVMPLTLSPGHKEIVFDKAYTFRDGAYLAKQVVNLKQVLHKKQLQNAFSCLPEKARLYYEGIAGGRQAISLLFLSVSPSRSDFDAEVSAYEYLLNYTADIRKGGVVIIKPHPRGHSSYLNAVVSALKAKFEEVTFVVIDQWATVPIEIAASRWAVSCCLGLLTSATTMMKWMYDVPAFCPVSKLREMYIGRPELERELNNLLKVDGKYLKLI